MDRENVIIVVKKTTHTHTHTHRGILFGLTKEDNLAICDNTDEPGGMLSEISQKERQLRSITDMWKTKQQKQNKNMKKAKTQKHSREVVARGCG